MSDNLTSPAARRPTRACLRTTSPNSGTVATITVIFEQMLTNVIAEGECLIASEQALKTWFVDQTVTDGSLLAMLTDIGIARTALRYTHL